MSDSAGQSISFYRLGVHPMRLRLPDMSDGVGQSIRVKETMDVFRLQGTSESMGMSIIIEPARIKCHI